MKLEVGLINDVSERKRYLDLPIDFTRSLLCKFRWASMYAMTSALRCLLSSVAIVFWVYLDKSKTTSGEKCWQVGYLSITQSCSKPRHRIISESQTRIQIKSNLIPRQTTPSEIDLRFIKLDSKSLTPLYSSRWHLGPWVSPCAPPRSILAGWAPWTPPVGGLYWQRFTGL